MKRRHDETTSHVKGARRFGWIGPAGWLLARVIVEVARALGWAP
jgi:hypothetical protein